MSEDAVSLEVRDLFKTYAKAADRVEVLRGISFALAAGESLAITGPSGSGKSTLLTVLGAMNPPTSGQGFFMDVFDSINQMFVGWYTYNTHKAVGISKWDPYNQYLAYHEGATGWKRGTYKRKGWLKDTARRVDYRAREWGAQLKRCEDDLDTGWWIFG